MLSSFLWTCLECFIFININPSHTIIVSIVIKCTDVLRSIFVCCGYYDVDFLCQQWQQCMHMHIFQSKCHNRIKIILSSWRCPYDDIYKLFDFDLTLSYKFGCVDSKLFSLWFLLEYQTRNRNVFFHRKII